MTSAKDIRSPPGQDIEWHQSQPQDQVLGFLSSHPGRGEGVGGDIPTPN